MPAGDITPAEWRTFTDAQTGVEVRQLTNYKGHSHHLYFTNSGWYDGGRRLLFGSDHGNRTNLFGVHLESGEITQLTDLDQPPPPAETSFLFTSVNPTRDEAYFWHDRDLVAVDLHSCDSRVLYQAPPGFMLNMTNVTADGELVCSVMYEDLSEQFGVDLLHGYVGFEEYWAANPLSRIIAVNTKTGEANVAFEEHSWIGHINTSPTRSDVLTFCHEGPWHKVDNRIWGLDIPSGKAWRIRETSNGERVGHEYWYADGDRVGYHGNNADGSAFFGSVRYDDSDRAEITASHGSMHFHSNGADLIVGDGSRTDPRLLLWRRIGDRYDGPRVLLKHRGSFQIQAVHVHPRLSADNTQVVFTTDASGYGNVHIVDIPEIDTLPSLTS